MSELLKRATRLRVLVFAALVIAARAPAACAQNLVMNGSFELPMIGGTFVRYGVGADFAGSGWGVDIGNVDHIRTYWQSAEGLQSLDLNGARAGGVFQDLATEPGQLYSIRFAYAGNPDGFLDKRFDVLWDGVRIAEFVFDQNQQTLNQMGWLDGELLATAADSSTRLRFRSLTGDMDGTSGVDQGYGPALDNVSVVPVPEPSALILLVTGIALLNPVGGRRSRQPRFGLRASSQASAFWNSSRRQATG